MAHQRYSWTWNQLTVEGEIGNDELCKHNKKATGDAGIADAHCSRCDFDSHAGQYCE